MIHYRCECGESTSFGSMSPAACEGCPKCGKRLNPVGLAMPFHTPEPHEFIKRYDEITGKSYEICQWCHKRKNLNEVPTGE
jgi:hypothetical protein